MIPVKITKEGVKVLEDLSISKDIVDGTGSKGTEGQVLTKGDNGVEWGDGGSKVDAVSKLEAAELFNDIYGKVEGIPDLPGEEGGDGEDSSGSGSGSGGEDSFELENTYRIAHLDGHEVVYAKINNHKYIIALNDVIQAQWKSNTVDISSYAPFIQTENTGGEWTFEQGLKELLVCNFSDYYNLDLINQQIMVGCNAAGITSMVHDVRKISLGGLRWNVANFEVMYFLYQNFDALLAGRGLAGSNIWLPYAMNSSNCWKVSIGSSTNSSIKCNRNGTTYTEYVVPVALV